MARKFVFLGILFIVICSFFVAGYYIIFDDSFVDTKTSAICFGNVCQDYEFTCSSGEIIGSVPIRGLVTFDEDWIDLRIDKNDKC